MLKRMSAVRHQRRDHGSGGIIAVQSSKIFFVVGILSYQKGGPNVVQRKQMYRNVNMVSVVYKACIYPEK
jgi:hypothetical protein